MRLLHDDGDDDDDDDDDSLYRKIWHGGKSCLTDVTFTVCVNELPLLWFLDLLPLSTSFSFLASCGGRRGPFTTPPQVQILAKSSVARFEQMKSLVGFFLTLT